VNLFTKGQSFIDLRRMKFRYFQGTIQLGAELDLYNLFCLHIHSKRLFWFKINTGDRIRRQIDKVNLGLKSRYFSPSILLEILWKNLKQGTLLRLVLHIPAVKSLRRRVL